MHATLDDRVLDAEQLGDARLHGYLSEPGVVLRGARRR
jgi:hypothetical protein